MNAQFQAIRRADIEGYQWAMESVARCRANAMRGGFFAKVAKRQMRDALNRAREIRAANKAIWG